MLDTVATTNAGQDEWVDFKPTNNTEPEVSIYPSGKLDRASRRLSKLKTYAQKIMSMEDCDRDYREYAFSMELRLKSGQGFPFSIRMRCYLQDIPDGSVVITDRQLTFKTPGNHADRQEIETEHDLRVLSVKEGLEALREEHGDDLPQCIRDLNPDDVYVHATCLNSRIGYDGILPSQAYYDDVKYKLMLNEDRVIFASPQIVNSTGKLIDLGARPEAEAECQKAILRKSIADTRTDAAWNSSIIDATQRVGHHFSTLFPKATPYVTNKVEEAGVRVDNKAALIQNAWNAATQQEFMQPQDYERASMQPALRVLLEACPSPFEDNDAEIRIRADLIAQTKAAGQRTFTHRGNSITL